MNSQLQALYADFVQIHTKYAGWHQPYMKIVNEVDAERKKLADNANYHLPDSMLHKLLWEDGNGISRKGQTPFTKDQYDAYMGKENGYKNFRPTIENLVKTPYDPVRPRIFIDAFDEFVKIFEECKNTYNRLNRAQARLPKLIINRIAAACTTYVSCVPAEPDFDEVFNWFVKQSVFPSLLYTKSDWLRNNMTLVRKIRLEFQTQLDEKQVGYDEFYLNIFLRYIYETKCLHPVKKIWH
jgi:hypothetical protein